MARLKKIVGFLLAVWAAIRWIPDLLESIQATEKYGRWLYVHFSVPRSGVLTIVILVIGLGLIFSETIEHKFRQWWSKEAVASAGDSFSLQTSSKTKSDGSVDHARTLERTIDQTSPVRDFWMDLYNERKRLQDEIEKLEERPKVPDFPYEVRMMTSSEMQRQHERDRKVERKKEELRIIDERIKALTPLNDLAFVSMSDRGRGNERKAVWEQRPDVVIEWDSGHPWKRDRIRLRNVGKESAFNVAIGKFSWPELSFPTPLEIQAIHPNDPEMTREPQFIEKRTSDRDVNIGYMGHVLDSRRYRDRAPLRLEITFSDRNRNNFRRTFILRRGSGGVTAPGVIVELGEFGIAKT
jgi:hypothetical protein